MGTNDPSGASRRTTNATGQISNGSLELDALGANAGLVKPLTWTVPDKLGLPVVYPEFADMITNPGGACVLDGMPIPCGIYNNLMNAGGIEVEQWYRAPEQSKTPPKLLPAGQGKAQTSTKWTWKVERFGIESHGLGIFRTLLVTDWSANNEYDPEFLLFPQNTLWLKSAKIFGQSADVDGRSAVFNLDPNNPHRRELCGEDDERKPFDVTLNLGLPNNIDELTPTNIERKPLITPKGESIMAESGFVGGSRVRTATEPPSESNYSLGKGVVRFDNQFFTIGSAQAIFSVSRRSFTTGAIRDLLLVTIQGKNRDGDIFRREFRVSIHCP